MAQRTVLVGVGSTMAIAARQDATDGTVALLDCELAPGFAALLPHAHQREEEALYVLEGCLLVQCGSDERLLGPGEFLLLPRGLVHAQSNPGQEPARFLTLFLPAGFEECLEDLDALLEDDASCPPETIRALLARYGVQSVGGPQS